MNTIALHRNSRAPTPIHTSAIVVSVDAELITLRMGCGLVQAPVAASCLIAPAIGDLVLVSGEHAEDCFVIAVLKRVGSTPIQVRFSGDCHLQIDDGALKLSATGGIQLEGGTEVRLSAAHVQMQSASAKLVTGQLGVIGRSFSATIDQIALVGNRAQVVFGNVVQRLVSSVREVEGMDVVRSGQIDYRAKENASLRGKNALLTASELVKVDGSQIHLG